MFGGDGSATLAIDRKEPLYDAVRGVVEKVEGSAVHAIGALTPVRLDRDEHGDVVHEKNMPVMVTDEVIIFTDDSAAEIVRVPTAMACAVRLAKLAKTLPLTPAVATELRGTYILFHETKGRGSTMALTGAIITVDIKNCDNAMGKVLFKMAMLAGKEAAAVLETWITNSHTIASESYKKLVEFLASLESRLNSTPHGSQLHSRYMGTLQAMTIKIEQYNASIQKKAPTMSGASGAASHAGGTATFTLVVAPSFVTLERDINKMTVSDIVSLCVDAAADDSFCGSAIFRIAAYVLVKKQGGKSKLLEMPSLLQTLCTSVSLSTAASKAREHVLATVERIIATPEFKQIETMSTLWMNGFAFPAPKQMWVDAICSDPVVFATAGVGQAVHNACVNDAQLATYAPLIGKCYVAGHTALFRACMPKTTVHTFPTTHLSKKILDTLGVFEGDFGLLVNELQVSRIFTFGKLYTSGHNLPNDQHTLSKAQSYIKKYRGETPDTATTAGSLKCIVGMYGPAKKANIGASFLTCLLEWASNGRINHFALVLSAPPAGARVLTSCEPGAALYAAFSAITDRGLAKMNLETPDLVSLRVEADSVRRNRHAYGMVPFLMGMTTKDYEVNPQILRSAGIVEIFRRSCLILLTEDARQIKAANKAVEALSGQAAAYEMFFQSWTTGMRDGFANEARALVQGAKFAALTDAEA